MFEVLDWRFEVGKTISISFFHISETLVDLDAANNGAQIAHKRGGIRLSNGDAACWLQKHAAVSSCLPLIIVPPRLLSSANRPPL